MKPTTPRTPARKSTITTPIKEAVYNPPFKYHPLNIMTNGFVNLAGVEREDMLAQSMAMFGTVRIFKQLLRMNRENKVSADIAYLQKHNYEYPAYKTYRR